MSVSISEILAGASAHAVPLAGECAGYLVLAAADQAVAAPRRIGPEEVRLLDDGTVRVEGARAAEEADAEADLRALLDALLLQASSATPALLRASRRPPGRGIAALVREIETALIPVNRAAAHRALARLERETVRARKSGRLEAVVPPAPTRREPAKVAVPAEALEVSPPVRSVEASPEPPATEVEDIPSLFAPPVASVESIAALAAEIETRPEPIVVRRSAPPPPPTKTPSPPPSPVAEAQRSTPVLGTVVESYSDDEMDIEVVVEDDAIDEELTGVLVRARPLEVSAMTGGVLDVSSETLRTVDEPSSPDPTDPCPPALEDEPVDAVSAAAPPVVAVSEPVGAVSEPDLASLIAEAAETPPESPRDPAASEPDISAGPLEPHGETLALALAIAPAVAEVTPAPRLPMPNPRPSDVDDLLDRMTRESGDDGADLRATLMGLAGLEPTPPPPET